MFGTLTFYHCEVPWKLQVRLFDTFSLVWASGCFINISICGLWHKVKAKPLCQGAFFAGPWTIWIKRNQGIFEKPSFAGQTHLGEDDLSGFPLHQGS